MSCIDSSIKGAINGIVEVLVDFVVAIIFSILLSVMGLLNEVAKDIENTLNITSTPFMSIDLIIALAPSIIVIMGITDLLISIIIGYKDSCYGISNIIGKIIALTFFFEMLKAFAPDVIISTIVSILLITIGIMVRIYKLAKQSDESFVYSY